MNEFMRLAGTAALRDWQDQNPHLFECLRFPGTCPDPDIAMHHYTCYNFKQLPMDVWIDPESDYPGLLSATGDSDDDVSDRQPFQDYPSDYAHNSHVSGAPVRDVYDNDLGDFGNSGAHATSYHRRRHRRTISRRIRRSSTGSALGGERISTFTGARETTRQSYRAEPMGLGQRRYDDRTATAGTRDTYRSAEVTSAAGPGGAYYHSRNVAQASTNRTSYREPTGGRESAWSRSALGLGYRSTHRGLYP